MVKLSPSHCTVVCPPEEMWTDLTYMSWSYLECAWERERYNFFFSLSHSRYCRGKRRDLYWFNSGAPKSSSRERKREKLATLSKDKIWTSMSKVIGVIGKGKHKIYVIERFSRICLQCAMLSNEEHFLF